MMGERDPFDYQLCEALGWGSVAAMHAGMSWGEYHQWRAYHVWHNAQLELERKAASGG